MREGWKTARLDEVCMEITDGSHFSPKTTDAGYPYVTVRDIENDEIDFQNCKFISALNYHKLLKNGCRPQRGNVLFSKDGTVGKVALIDYDKEFVVLSSLAIVRPDNERIQSAFLKWVMKSPAFLGNAVGKKTGVAIRRIILRNLKSIPIPVPPLPEQQRIVGILDEAFEGIAAAKTNAEKNLQNANAIFASHLQAVFTRRGKGWLETTIGDVCTLKSGTTVPVKIERSNGDIPYVKVAEMTIPANREGVTSSIRFLDQSDVKPGWIIPAGAVIFPKRGGAILTNKKRLALVDICADLNIMSVIPSDKLAPDFLYLYFLTVDMRKLGTGSSIPQINNYDIAPLLIGFPKSKAQQTEIAEVLRAVETECRALASLYERKLSALEALKQSLLHQAFTGQL